MQKDNETTEEKPGMLIPQKVREVDFYGDVLLVAVVDEIAYVALRPIVEFLGIEWAPQYQRLQRDEILDEERRLVIMAGADGRQREMVALPLEFLPGWLFGITGSRLKDTEKAEKLKRYRRECFSVLWREFGQPIATPVPSSPSATALTQVRDLALAVAQMAEQQIELQGQVMTVNARVDRAAIVVSDLQRRLSHVERQVEPQSTIREEQAAEISNQVKALAELLTSKHPGKNHYQSIFGEIYRRFGVSSYKRIRQGQYEAVLAFLDDWRKAAQQPQ